MYVNLERVRWLKALAQGAQQRSVFVFGPGDELVVDESLDALVHRIQRGEPR